MNLDDTARQYFLILDKTLPAEILKSFTEASASEVIFYHYTIGMWVRNHFLSPDDDLYKAFLAIEIYDKDSMSYFFTYMYHLHRQVFSKSGSTGYRAEPKISLIDKWNQKYAPYRFFSGVGAFLIG